MRIPGISAKNKLRGYRLIKQLALKLPVFRRREYTRFLLLSYPRSGTTWLHTHLNSHLRILSFGEQLKALIYELDGEKILQKKFSRPMPRLLKAVGMKLFYKHALTENGTTFLKYWLKKKYAIIHLRRRNLLRVVLSEEIARSTNVWSSGTRDKAPLSKQLYLEPAILLEKITQLQEHERYFEGLLLDKPGVLSLWYEDMQANPQQQLSLVQQFLGVEPKNLYSLLKKQNPEPLQQLISNYAAVESALRSNGWQNYLED